ncbi:hypothetical protein KR093_003968, partial [Drosophila rubida]
LSKKTHNHNPYSALSHFPTGSKFSGTSNEMGMQEYGLYMWPDGSRYVGLFRNNKFHGDGFIELKAPYSINFKVHHEDGKLMEIYSISFADYLQLDFEWSDDTLTFDNWDYCTSKDRRFCNERMGQLVAVGPATYNSSEGPTPPELAPNIFDLGFGKFNSLGCVTEMPTHWSPVTECYVNCGESRAWIQNNCRHGELNEMKLDPEVLAHFARQIIHCNLKNDRKLVGKPHSELGSLQRLKTRSSPHSSSDCSLAKKLLHCGSSVDSSSS